jgi:hypothetical protein
MSRAIVEPPTMTPLELRTGDTEIETSMRTPSRRTRSVS